MILVALFAGLLLLSDVEEITRVIRQADWKPLPGAFLFTFISYACTSYAFARVSQVMGIRMRARDLTEIGFISIVLNHVISGGGIAGYSIRYLLMKEYGGVALKDVLSASIVHFYLTSLDMLALLPFGFFYLFLFASPAAGVGLALVSAALLLAGVFVIATGLVFNQRVRGVVIRAATRIGCRVTGRDIRGRLEEIDNSLAHGISAIRSQPHALAWIMALTLIDLISSVGGLWFCFDALGPPVTGGQLFTGFGLGVMAGVLSMIPGGIGVQEGSMAGIFALVGVSFHQAILASVLFRGIYYFGPYIVSLGVYWRLFQKVRRAALKP